MVYYSKDNHQIFASTYNILSIIVSAQHLLCLMNEKFDKETVWGLRLQSKIEIWFGRHEEGSWHKKWSCPRWAVKVAWRFFFIQVVQSGASNRAKHGGAYFLAVGRSIKDPLAAPERYETQECYNFLYNFSKTHWFTWCWLQDFQMDFLFWEPEEFVSKQEGNLTTHINENHGVLLKL